VILKQLEKAKTGDHVFPGQARNKPLSNMAMEMMLRRMKVENATVHGFRSSFRDWAGNETSFPRDLIETAVCTENLNPNVLTMKSAQYGARIYDARSLNLRETGASLFNDRCVLTPL
jgi:hypothetical protein